MGYIVQFQNKNYKAPSIVKYMVSIVCPECLEFVCVRLRVLEFKESQCYETDLLCWSCHWRNYFYTTIQT